MTMLCLVTGLFLLPVLTLHNEIVPFGQEPSGQGQYHEPSRHALGGALADLHDAVGGIRSWTPYTHHNNDATKSPTINHDHESGEQVVEPANKHDTKPTIAKCTIIYNGDAYWERALLTHHRHNTLHNYRFHILRQHLLTDIWSKPAYILHLLLAELSKPPPTRLQWLLWVDADTILLNPSLPFSLFLPPPTDPLLNTTIHLLYTTDWNGLNNGVFPIRVHEWSVNIFTAILAFRYYRPDEKLRFKDQSAMETLLKGPEFARHSVEVPSRWFNAYQSGGKENRGMEPYEVRKGDLLVHFAGAEDREGEMGGWLDRVERREEGWEVNVKETGLEGEVGRFWREKRDERRREAEGWEVIRGETGRELVGNEEMLMEFGGGLSREEREKVGDAQYAVAELLRDEEKWHDEPEALAELRRKLRVACEPLRKAAEKAGRNAPSMEGEDHGKV